MTQKCRACGGAAPASERCTNGHCRRCHDTFCTLGGATSPGHGVRCCEIQVRPTPKCPWTPASPYIFRSWGGPRRLQGRKYHGPVYVLGTWKQEQR